MDAQTRALARADLYTLFAEVYATGLTPAHVALLQTLPELADLLPDPYDSEAEAVAFQHLFGFSVYPYAGVFLNPDAQAGGLTVTEVHGMVQSFDFSWNTTTEAMDHIAQGFRILAQFSVALAHAQTEAKRQHLHVGARTFLDTYFLQWIPAFTRTVARHKTGFWQGFTQLSLDVLIEHRAEDASETVLRPSALIAPPDLSQPHTDLRAIAAYLVCPAQAGLFLSRTDLTHLARRYHIPHGFGSRQQMLHALFQSAVTFDVLPDLLRGLRQIIAEETQFYQNLVQQNKSSRVSWAMPWQVRLTQTDHLLQKIYGASNQSSNFRLFKK